MTARELIQRKLTAALADEPDGGGEGEAPAEAPKRASWLRRAAIEPSANGSANGKPRVKGQDLRHERRVAAAKVLAVECLGTDALRARIDWPRGSMNDLLEHEWFERDGPGRRDPWRLTEAGRKAVAAPGEQ